MNVLIYLSCVGIGSPVGQHIDMAIEEIKKGNKVFILNCDKTVGLCIDNYGLNHWYCIMCQKLQSQEMKRLLPKGIEQHWIGEYTKKVDTNKIPTFEYQTAKELRSLKYDGIDIGLATMSTYISLTRNLNPKITEESKKYFDALIHEQILMNEALKLIRDDFDFNLVIFQNARGAQVKAFYNFCKNYRINFWCTEEFARERNYVNNFFNSTAHDIGAYTKKYQECWEFAPETKDEREKIGRMFYENRRNARFAGDKNIYVKKQVNGLLPKDWNSSKENIVIFNSSEDEYAAVSKEYDDEAFFESQLVGIRTIIEKYRDDRSKHFTLRIHPNLKNIPYKYHNDLFKLDYPNLTVIPGSDPVSSYSLMDAADKIIVFGSTMGIESVYWGKPVICLAGAFYRDLNVVYKPQTMAELWHLIEDKELPCLYNEKILWFGYFYMSNNHERTKYVDIDIKKIKFLGKTLSCYKYQKVLGSNFLYALLMKVMTRFKLSYPAKFRTISSEEA